MKARRRNISMTAGDAAVHRPPPGARERRVDTAEYVGALRELIEQGHEVALPVAGGSMAPFLGGGRDRVFLARPDRPLRRGDVVLYRRTDGTYVLHRVYRFRGETCDIVGDAQDRIERGVRREQIFARMTRAERKGKLIGPRNLIWQFFQYVWIGLVPLRRPLLGLYGIGRGTIEKQADKTLKEDPE
ncbi:MAG: S24/S26 family peptidase [Oscillospiraceae bacterium]|nr:S24/S26 family peptidase [Oscillospiraceae bacterium]